MSERVCRLTGAQAALVVNNGAAALLLALAALAGDGEVVVSRGELVEVGGGFRIPDVIEQGGARLVEVGSTNCTRIDDYARAIGERTRMLLACHPSNYRVVGYTERPSRTALAALARERGLVFVEDLGSGALVDTGALGLPAEPTVGACLRAGADLVTFSGDKLLGGPQSGIVAGRADLVAAMERHPLTRALRCDKLVLAALEATLALYESGSLAREAVPVLRMLSEDPASVRRRALRLARRLRALHGLDVRVSPARSVPGGGSLPDATLPSTQVTVRAAGLSAEALARRLRSGTPALVGRIVSERFAMDLRTVGPDEVGPIVRLFAEAAAA